MIWFAAVIGVFLFWGDEDSPSIFTLTKRLLSNKVTGV